MKGKVFLIGAGPGDPELLTVKALRVLGSADAVVHDELVSPEVLALIPASARVHNMGKFSGKQDASQEEIHRLLVTHASEGLRVVRLAGGDPLIFGRVGEEMEALRSTGIDFEVIPGVTTASAAAACAGIPLTDRRHASKLVFFSYQGPAEKHSAGESDGAMLDATFVIHIESGKSEGLTAKLREAGLPEKTACLLVSRPGTRNERILRTSLTNLEADLANPRQFSDPALLILGGVAGAVRPERELQLRRETLLSLAEARTAVAAS